MRTLLLSFTVLLSMSFTQLAAGQTKKPAPAKSSTATSSAAKKSSSKKSSKTAASKKKATVVRSVQQHPTTERYTEIQQALVDRGYLNQADGQWDAESVEALKKFQQDQELAADGKLGALSLMALGLGPRRGAFVVAAPVPNYASPTPVE